jgi:hypothetical protein
LTVIVKVVPIVINHANPSYVTILSHINPVLGKDFEINNETTADGMQRRGKHASTTTELLLETVFTIRSVQRGYKEEKIQSVESQPVKRRLGSWCEMAASLGVTQLRAEFCTGGT